MTAWQGKRQENRPLSMQSFVQTTEFLIIPGRGSFCLHFFYLAPGGVFSLPGSGQLKGSKAHIVCFFRFKFLYRDAILIFIFNRDCLFAGFETLFRGILYLITGNVFPFLPGNFVCLLFACNFFYGDRFWLSGIDSFCVGAADNDSIVRITRFFHKEVQPFSLVPGFVQEICLNGQRVDSLFIDCVPE